MTLLCVFASSYDLEHLDSLSSVLTVLEYYSLGALSSILTVLEYYSLEALGSIFIVLKHYGLRVLIVLEFLH